MSFVADMLDQVQQGKADVSNLSVSSVDTVVNSIEQSHQDESKSAEGTVIGQSVVVESVDPISMKSEPKSGLGQMHIQKSLK